MDFSHPDMLRLDASLGASPIFSRAVNVLRRTMLCPSSGYVPLPGKLPSFLDQHSPLGHTRIVADAASVQEHISRSMGIDSDVRRDPWATAPSDLADAVRFVCGYSSNPSSLLHRRRVVNGILQETASVLQPLTDELFQMAPPHVALLPSRHHIAFIAALVRACNWPHSSLPACLLFGTPTSGQLPASGVFRKNVKHATVSSARFDNRAWASELRSRIGRIGARSSKKAAALSAAALAKSIDETTPVNIHGVETGRSWTLGPYDWNEINAVFPDGFWPSRRFGVLQKGEVRPCDDCKESELNASATTHESISCDGADFPARLADMYHSILGPLARLEGGTDDWKKAYRQIPTDDPSRSVVAQWDPERKQVVYFIVLGHCFGQVCAVNSFNAVSRFLSCATRSMCGAAVGNYFDDHITVEPSFTEGSGQYALGHLARLCGFLFDPKKHVPMAPLFTYLGVQHDLSKVPAGIVTLRILENRREALIDACREVLCSGRLSSGAAASLRGKLYFAATTAYGRVGRAALQPILQRQERGSERNSLTPAMVRSLSFFITLLNHMPDREITLGSQGSPPVLVWSDASWESGVGRLGFVVYDPASDTFYESDSMIPQYILDFFIKKKQKIGQCEILAATAVYSSLPEILRGRRVIHFIDNTSAISCLLHGYSGKPDSALLVNAFHLYNAGLKADIHFEYVESKANVADLPSRGMFEYLRCQRPGGLAAQRVEFAFHSESTWLGPLRTFILAAGGAAVKRHKRGSRGGASRAERRKRARQGA